MKIIYVHGRAQEGKSAHLKSNWDQILIKGFEDAKLSWPAGATSEAPFYGDKLADATAQADKGDVFGLVRLGPHSRRGPSQE